MTLYIKNLTDYLIGKHSLDEVFLRHNFRRAFIGLTSAILEVDDVGEMKPETLGQIMCAFETGDLIISREELFADLHFSGHMDNTLREMVALVLATIIHTRLDPTMKDYLTTYTSSRPTREALVK